MCAHTLRVFLPHHITAQTVALTVHPIPYSHFLTPQTTLVSCMSTMLILPPSLRPGTHEMIKSPSSGRRTRSSGASSSRSKQMRAWGPLYFSICQSVIHAAMYTWVCDMV